MGSNSNNRLGSSPPLQQRAAGEPRGWAPLLPGRGVSCPKAVPVTSLQCMSTQVAAFA
jgi:hypothetical protein